MLQLNPSETHKINRILRDWADNTTYYVRAKVYDAETRTLVSTINLTDNGSRWFSGEWKVPHDNVFGNGVRYVIVTEVYTDSGYSTRSENHYDEVEDVLVQMRWNPTVAFSGGGDYDNKTLMKEIRELFEAANKPKEVDPDAPVEESIDIKFGRIVARLLSSHTDRILSGVSDVGKKVAKIPTDKAKEPEKLDLAPVLLAVTALTDLIKALPKPEKTDFNPLLLEIGRNLGALKRSLIEEIGVQASKELTLSFADSPEQKNKGKRSAFLQGLAIKHGIKQK